MKCNMCLKENCKGIVAASEHVSVCARRHVHCIMWDTVGNITRNFRMHEWWYVLVLPWNLKMNPFIRGVMVKLHSWMKEYEGKENPEEAEGNSGECLQRSFQLWDKKTHCQTHCGVKHISAERQNNHVYSHESFKDQRWRAGENEGRKTQTKALWEDW